MDFIFLWKLHLPIVKLQGRTGSLAQIGEQKELQFLNKKDGSNMSKRKEAEAPQRHILVAVVALDWRKTKFVRTLKNRMKTEPETIWLSPKQSILFPLGKKSYCDSLAEYRNDLEESMRQMLGEHQVISGKQESMTKKLKKCSS